MRPPVQCLGATDLGYEGQPFYRRMTLITLLTLLHFFRFGESVFCFPCKPTRIQEPICSLNKRTFMGHPSRFCLERPSLGMSGNVPKICLEETIHWKPLLIMFIDNYLLSCLVKVPIHQSKLTCFPERFPVEMFPQIT